MRRTMLRIFAFCILLLCRNARATTPFDGNWAGAFQRDGTWSMFLIHVRSSAHGPAATIDLISTKSIGQSVDSVSADSNHNLRGELG
jgi:hypothetical protein